MQTQIRASCHVFNSQYKNLNIHICALKISLKIRVGKFLPKREKTTDKTKWNKFVAFNNLLYIIITCTWYVAKHFTHRLNKFSRLLQFIYVKLQELTKVNSLLKLFIMHLEIFYSKLLKGYTILIWLTKFIIFNIITYWY